MRIGAFIVLMLVYFESMSQPISSSSRMYALRLAPHQDVKKSIVQFAAQNKIKAGCIVSAVGSLEQFNLRFANQEKGTLRKGYFEIVSLTGTFSDNSSHLHLSVSDQAGRTTGGHLLDDNLIYTTLEIVIADLVDVEFSREADPTYNYQELKVIPRKKN